MSEKVYALLLRLYPASFRNSYGDEALQLFRDRAREERGFAPALRLWVDLLADLAVSVPREHRPRRPALVHAAAWSGRGVPSFHLLEGEAPRFPSLLYGGALTLLLYAFLLFLANHGRSHLRFADGSAQQRASSSGASAPGQSTQKAQGAAAAPARGNAKPDNTPSDASARAAPGTARTLSPAQSKAAEAHLALAVKEPFRRFDLALVKRNRSSDPVSINFPLGPGEAYIATGGYFHVTNLPLIGYIAFAYKLDDEQAAALRQHAPDWVKDHRYDVEARVKGDPGKEDMRAMMRTLLDERFRLKMRSDPQQVAGKDAFLLQPGVVDIDVVRRRERTSASLGRKSGVQRTQ